MKSTKVQTLTPHPSHLTPHPSPLTTHTSHLTPHPSPLTPHPSHLSIHHLPLLLTTHHSLLPCVSSLLCTNLLPLIFPCPVHFMCITSSLYHSLSSLLLVLPKIHSFFSSPFVPHTLTPSSPSSLPPPSLFPLHPQLVYMSGHYRADSVEPYLVCVVHPVTPPTVLKVKLESSWSHTTTST